MPLINSDSDKALEKNIKTEIKAGRDQKQAIAIALDIQRRAKARKRRKANHAIVDPAEKIKQVDFAGLEAALKDATPQDTEQGSYIRMVKIGSVEDLSPSGKYFICWAGDHSNPEIEADVSYWKMFEDELEKFAFPAWLEQEDGIVYVGAHLESDQEDYSLCPNCENHNVECSCYSNLSVGDMVKWGSSGGKAQGRIKKIVRDGKVPEIPVKVEGTKDDPAAQIEVYKDGKASGVLVGHKLSSLTKL